MYLPIVYNTVVVNVDDTQVIKFLITAIFLTDVISLSRR